MAESAFQLPTLISAAAVLSGSESRTSQSPNVASVLKSRLTRTYNILGKEDRDMGCVDLVKLQYATAKESLWLVETVQDLLDPVEPVHSDSASMDTPPLLGTRDLSHIRTLLSIIFRWAVEPLITELEVTRAGPGTPASLEARVIDLTERQFRFEELPAITSRLLALTFGPGLSGKLRQTWITTSILTHHTTDILTPCLIIGWSPKPISDSFACSSKDIKALSIRLINVLRPHEAISALGAVLSAVPTERTRFAHVPKACANLLSNQLRRPDGVRGLCITVFGEDAEEAEVAPLEKLEHIARVLRTVPAATTPQPYFQFMIPRILELLLPAFSQQTPPSHKRAAACALSRMLSPTFQHHAIACAILLPLFHTPFLFLEQAVNTAQPTSLVPAQPLRLSPVDALQTLQIFFLHTDPSPTELSTLLDPIVPEIYTLASLYRTSKIADPNVRESLNALLNIWGRIVDSSDASKGLWSVVSGMGGDWELGPEGFMRITKPTSGPSITLFTAAELSESKDNIDIHANPFNLRPDPAGFVAFLKSLDRKDVSSEIFVKLLNEYRALKESDADPMQTLLYLQLILQMHSQLSTAILSKPEHVLSFIKHALRLELPSPTNRAHKSTEKRGLGLKDLRIVAPEQLYVGDSDDENEDMAEGIEGPAENTDGKDEMIVTAITLLLSILEGDSRISSQDAPDLNDILTLLEHIISHTSPAIRQLAREARLVLTARTASTSSMRRSSASRPTAETETAQATYQQALKLLQDPIIPVRAHGLQILRELVSRPSASGFKASRTGLTKPLLDPELVPSILSIFIQSMQDDESYIFLNAVQGLAAMVDGYGKDVLRRIMDVYLSGTRVGASGGRGDATTMSREELDVRVRVGEALNTVVKRCGGALGLYVDILIPPLLTILRSSHLPTTLRTSAVSILAQCVRTNPLALSLYTEGLAGTCIELIKLESVAAKNQSSEPKEREPLSGPRRATVESDEEAKYSARLPELTDTVPTTSNTRIAPFRRSALHFLSQLLRSHIDNIYNSRSSPMSFPSVTMNVGGERLQNWEVREMAIPESVLKHATLALRYVTATDEDAVTRVMAREALELVGQYREACMGF